MRTTGCEQKVALWPQNLVQVEYRQEELFPRYEYATPTVAWELPPNRVKRIARPP